MEKHEEIMSPTAGDSSLFEEIVELSPAIALVWRVEDGRPVEFVSGSVGSLGYTPDELISGAVKCDEVIHPEDRERVAAEVADYLSSGIKRYQQRYRVLHKDGREIWVDDWTAISAPLDGLPELAYGIIVDVSENVASELRLHSYLNASGSVFLFLNQDGSVSDFNNTACEITHRTPEQLLGANWIDEFVPEDIQPRVNAIIEKVFSGSIHGPIELVDDIEVEGSRRLIRWTFTLDRSARGEVRGMACFGQDITEKRGLNDRLADIVTSIPGALFEYTIHPDGSDSIDFLNEYCETLWEVSKAELQSDPSILWGMVVPADLPAMQQAVMHSAQEQTVWFHEWRITTRGGNEKWLQGSGAPRRLADGGTRWAITINDVTAVKSALSSKLAVVKKAVHALAAVVEARDPYTAGHEANVARLSVKIAEQLGLAPDVVEGLELAATIHDIGKISIPAEILNKPGKLSDIEFALMKNHPRAGAEFVRDIDFDRPISKIIEQHHERLDGTGYPDGLIGDEILLEARIIAVADTFEAIASHRPYRPSLGFGKALQVLEEGRGSVFDKDVVDACIALVNTGAIPVDKSEGIAFSPESPGELGPVGGVGR